MWSIRLAVQVVSTAITLSASAGATRSASKRATQLAALAENVHALRMNAHGR